MTASVHATELLLFSILLQLTSASDFAWLALLLALSILGKIVPVYVAGRVSGFSDAQSAVLGSLMNTRALMELIVLNIGYDFGSSPCWSSWRSERRS
jgi:Kef-type K+ transport system membrane component KefB